MKLKENLPLHKYINIGLNTHPHTILMHFKFASISTFTASQPHLTSAKLYKQPAITTTKPMIFFPPKQKNS